MSGLRPVPLALVMTATGTCAVWLWAEFVDWRASRSQLGPRTQLRGRGAATDLAGRDHTRAGPAQLGSASSEPAQPDNTGRGPALPTDSRSEAVVVLGYRNRGERANFVNRFRVRAGIRSLDPTATSSLLVLCGGAVGGATSEAVIMRRYARDDLGFTGEIALDPDSRSTWENITNAIPHIEHADTIKIVSNGPHAKMGREILWRQRPDVAARLVRGDEHRFGEGPILKILSALRIVQARITGALARSTRAPDDAQSPTDV